MSDIVQVDDFRFPNGDWPIASLRVRLAAIAERLGMNIETWEENGLGQAHGMFIRFPSGRVRLLRELDHAIEHLGEEGPTVFVDVGELAAFGVEPLVTEVLTTLNLARDSVFWVAPDAARESAGGLLSHIQGLRQSKSL